MEDSIRVSRATGDEADKVAGLVTKLLILLSSSQNEFSVNHQELVVTASDLLLRNNYAAFIAYNSENSPIGLVTISQASALYNGGDFGVITELFVDETHRSKGLGASLLHEANKFARSQGWMKLEVGAPMANKWPRTRDFYVKNGFKEKGVKLRLNLD